VYDYEVARYNVEFDIGMIRQFGGTVTKQDPLALQVPGYSGQSNTESIQGFTPLFRLNPNEALMGAFSVAHNTTNLNSISGTTRDESWLLSAGAAYYWGSNYLTGAAAGSFGHSGFLDPVDGIGGNYGSNGYITEFAAGHIFTLWQAARAPAGQRKSPRIRTGLLGVYLDLQGSFGYAQVKSNTFTDSIGLMWGTNDIHTGILGAKATLTWTYATYNALLMPYVSASVDQYVGYSHALNIPAQLSGPADAFLFSDAHTWGKFEAGVRWATSPRLMLTASGWYQFSSDMNVAGSKISLKIPFL
jgi:hypothetical protein